MQRVWIEIRAIACLRHPPQRPAYVGNVRNISSISHLSHETYFGAPNSITSEMKKGKVFPLQARCGPEGG